MALAYPCLHERKPRLPHHHEPYLHRHQLLELIHDLAAALAVAKPADPLPFMLAYLKNSEELKPCQRTLLLPRTNPRPDQTELARMMSTMTGQVPVSRKDLTLRPARKLAKRWRSSPDEDFPPEEYINSYPLSLKSTNCSECARMLARRAASLLLQPESLALGWMLVDYPASWTEANAMLKAGVLPTHILEGKSAFSPEWLHTSPSIATKLIETPDLWPDKLAFHSAGKHGCSLGLHEGIDGPPVTHDPRLGKEAMLRTMRKTPFFQMIEVPGKDKAELAADTVGRAFGRRRPKGFRWTPRVALVGPECANLSWYAERVGYKFGLVRVNFWLLVSEVVQPVGYSIAGHSRTIDARTGADLVAKRVSQFDCVTNGYVLYGFPRTAEDVRQLDRTRYPPNRIFLWNCSVRWCLRNVSGGSFWKEHGSKDISVLRSFANDHRNKLVLYDTWGYAQRLEDLERHCGWTAFHVDGEKSRDLVYSELETELAQASPPVGPRPTLKDHPECCSLYPIACGYHATLPHRERRLSIHRSYDSFVTN